MGEINRQESYAQQIEFSGGNNIEKGKTIWLSWRIYRTRD